MLNEIELIRLDCVKPYLEGIHTRLGKHEPHHLLENSP